MNCISLRYLMMVISMKKLSSTFQQTLKLLQLIQIIRRPIASSSFISNSLLQISSCQHISKLFLTTITGSNISLYTNQTWKPIYLRMFSSFQDRRCFLRSLDMMRLIYGRLSSGGKIKMILERSSSSKNSVFFWQNCKICLKSFSFRQEMIILSKTSNLMQLLPIMTISAISSVSYIIFAPFCSSYFLQIPNIVLKQLSFQKCFIADFVYVTLLFHIIKLSETYAGLVRILWEYFNGFNAQFNGLLSIVFTFVILNTKIISSYFWLMKYNIFVPDYSSHKSLFFFNFQGYQKLPILLVLLPVLFAYRVGASSGKSITLMLLFGTFGYTWIGQLILCKLILTGTSFLILASYSCFIYSTLVGFVSVSIKDYYRCLLLGYVSFSFGGQQHANIVVSV